MPGLLYGIGFLFELTSGLFRSSDRVNAGYSGLMREMRLTMRKPASDVNVGRIIEKHLTESSKSENCSNSLKKQARNDTHHAFLSLLKFSTRFLNKALT